MMGFHADRSTRTYTVVTHAVTISLAVMIFGMTMLL